MPSILQIAFSVGLFLMIVSIFGGSIEIKEVKIPSLPPLPRALSFLVGSALVGICIFKPAMFPKDDGGPSSKVSEKTDAVELSAPALDKVHHSDDLRVHFAFPYKFFVLDVTQSKNGLISLLDTNGHLRVKLTRKALPEGADAKRDRESERAALEKLGYKFTYVAPEKETNWKNWYVLSGLTNDTAFYFRRWYFTDGVAAIEFTYPTSDRPIYDRLISAMIQDLVFEGNPYSVPPVGPAPAKSAPAPLPVASAPHAEAETETRESTETENVVCRQYAQAAVDANRRNVRLGCGLSGPRWQESFDAHYGWCVTADAEAQRAESNARQRQLARCRRPAR